MNQKQICAAVEAMLFACADPVSAEKLAQAVQLPQKEVEAALEQLYARYQREDSGLCLLHLNTRWQLATKTRWADCVRRLLDARRSTPLTPAAMETLTVIAYNQPVSRAFIEQVRGVDSSSSVSGLLEKGLIEEAGRLDLPGRPVSFRTTDAFLRTFGLSSLADLPPIREESAPPAPKEEPR
ncbi:MAG: SMC-Scp complex subunit ScpB [Faecalibacterium sp.]